MQARLSMGLPGQPVDFPDGIPELPAMPHMPHMIKWALQLEDWSTAKLFTAFRNAILSFLESGMTGREC